MDIEGGRMKNWSVTHHAIQRYIERVDRSASRAEAFQAIQQIAQTARARANPRHWTRVATDQPGSRYLYSANRSDVCLVAVGSTIVTVFSRSVCAAWRPARTEGARPGRRLDPRRPSMRRRASRREVA
jgi:hypothetical protein